MSAPEGIIQALHTIYDRLDTLSSITASAILTPGVPQGRYHEIIEEAYAAYGQVETELETLHTELEYQHQRLDEARDAALDQEPKQ